MALENRPAHPWAKHILQVSTGVTWVQIDYEDLHNRRNVVAMGYDTAKELLSYLQSALDVPPPS